VGGSVSCMGGSCVQVCPSGQSNCGGTCRPTGGTCTTAGSGGCQSTGTIVCSGAGTTCSGAPRTSGSCTGIVGGVCNASGDCVCPAGQTNCGGTCRNLSTDAGNCGACGRGCSAPVGGSVSCMSGACVLACPAGQSNCGGFCRVTGAGCTSAGSGGCQNSGTIVCSGTGTVCNAVPRTSGACTSPPGGVCGAGGVCSCPAGTTNCGGTCVNLSSNANNCGACGRTCGAGRACEGGVCLGSGNLRFTMTWSRAGDMDLHVTPPCGTEIFFGRSSACGGTLDRDDTTATGPENIFWSSTPARGTYRVCVSPYRISGPTNWTVNIYHGTTLVSTRSGSASSSLGTGCSTVYTHTY
jgi:hypothetical protein